MLGGQTGKFPCTGYTISFQGRAQVNARQLKVNVSARKTWLNVACVTGVEGEGEGKKRAREEGERDLYGLPRRLGSTGTQDPSFNLRLLETPFSPGFRSLLIHVGVFVFATTLPMNQKNIQ